MIRLLHTVSAKCKRRGFGSVVSLSIVDSIYNIHISPELTKVIRLESQKFPDS